MIFLETKDDSLGSQYWNNKEVKTYGMTNYCLIENELEFGFPNYLQLLSYATVKVLSIKQNGEYYKITSLMEFDPNDSLKLSTINYIFHVYAGYENGTP